MPAETGVLPRRYTPGSAMHSSPRNNSGPGAENVAREALKFVLSPEGGFFRDFLMTEIVQSVDAMTRKQASSCTHALMACP